MPQQRPGEREVRRVEVRGLVGGTVVNVPSTEIPPGASPCSFNLMVDGGVLRKRPLLSAKGTGVLDAVGRAFYEYRKLAGTVKLLGVSEDSLYYDSSGTWTQVTLGDFTGGPDDHFRFTTFVDTLLVTNGKDHVKKWTGSSNTSDLGGGTGYQTPAYHVAKDVVMWKNRVVLLHTWEDGVRCPQRFRYSAVGTLETWPSAGFFDLQEKPDGIVRGMVISQKLAIYKDRSIVLGYYVGGTQVFDFVTATEETGLLAPDSLCALNTKTGQGHIFLSREGVKVFEGSSYLHHLSGAIDRDLLTSLNFPYASRAKGAVVPLARVYLLAVPDSEGELKVVWVLDLEGGGWTKWTLGTAITGLGDYGGEGADYVPSAARKVLVGEGTTVKQWELENYAAGDLGVEWQTKDFELNEKGGDLGTTVYQLTVEAKGSGTMGVSHSENGGGTWSTEQSFVLGSSWTNHEYQVKFTALRARFRIRQVSGASGDLELKRLCVQYQGRETK